MATGAQAAQLMLSKAAVKEPTADNTCVQGLREEIFGPLGVKVPTSNTVSSFLVPPLTRINAPFVGCIARFPQALGYEHVCLITGISGDSVQETSFGTSVGYVRSATFPSEWYESFWDPHYDGGLSVVTASNQTSTTDTSFVGQLQQFAKITGELSSPAFWMRTGLFFIGVILILIVLFKMFSDSDAGQAVIGATKKAVEVAVVA